MKSLTKKRRKTHKPAHIFLSFFLVLSLLPIVSAAITTEEIIDNLLNFPLVDAILGSPINSMGAFEGYTLGKTGAIIIHIMLWLMLFVAFSDIMGTFLPLTNKYAPWVLGFGLTVIAANFGTMPWIVNLLGTFTAKLGALSVFASIILAFFFFFFATWAGNKLKIKMMELKTMELAEIKGTKIKALEKMAEKSIG